MLGWVDTETGALILSADRDELRRLVGSLRLAAPETIVLGEARNWPMARPIAALSVELGGDAIAIKVTGDTARFTGSVTGFERLARELERFSGTATLGGEGGLSNWREQAWDLRIPRKRALHFSYASRREDPSA